MDASCSKSAVMLYTTTYVLHLYMKTSDFKRNEKNYVKSLRLKFVPFLA